MARGTVALLSHTYLPTLYCTVLYYTIHAASEKVAIQPPHCQAGATTVQPTYNRYVSFASQILAMSAVSNDFKYTRFTISGF